MKKSDDLYLGHIRDVMDRIDTYLEDIEEDEFFGEASNKLSDKIKKETADAIPWREIVGLRNRVIHDYTEINYQVIWDTVKEDFPLLRKELKIYLDDLESRFPSEIKNKENPS